MKKKTKRATRRKAPAPAPDLAPAAIPQQYSLVRHVAGYGPKGAAGPFSAGQILIFFGEIPNMPGHAIVADHKTGKLYSGYHTERFEQIPDDET